MRLNVISLGLAVLLAGCASTAPTAISPTASQATASAPESRAARAKAEALIAGVAGADIFENVSRGERVRVRHKRSGLICTFPEATPGQHLNIYPRPLPRGDDVGCQLATGDHFHTLIATRLPGRAPSLDMAMQGSVNLIRVQYPTLRPFEGPSADVVISRPDLRAPAPHRSASFIVPLNGRDHYTRVSVAVMDGWILKQRYTAPLDDAVAADLTAGLTFSDALLRRANPNADLDAPPPANAAPPSS